MSKSELLNDGFCWVVTFEILLKFLWQKYSESGNPYLTDARMACQLMNRKNFLANLVEIADGNHELENVINEAFNHSLFGVKFNGIV